MRKYFLIDPQGNPENVFPVPLLSLLLGVLLINPYEKAILTDGFFLYKWNET